MILTQIFLFEFLNDDTRTERSFLMVIMCLINCGLIIYLCRIEML